MLKSVITLFRGTAAAAAEEFADRNALVILDQQLRDCQASLTAAQRALAVALAEDAQEGRRCSALEERIAGLEARARAALVAGREDMATEAAETIAGLEEDCQAGRKARALFASEIVQLRRSVGESGRRLAELHRGRRVARVAEAVRTSRRGRIEPADPALCTLSEAEATLARLRERQQRAADAVLFLGSVEAETMPEERLAEAGFGSALRPTATAVLARLKQA